MNIDHLKEFVHLTETLNFSLTAQHFYVSTSVISRHIASLEEELGVRLFERGSGQVSITKSGRIFLEDALTILHDYDNALERLALMDDRTEAIVRVAYLDTASRPFIGKFMRCMKRNNPEIRVVFQSLEFRDVYDALDEHRADLVFMMDVFGDGGRDYRRERIYSDHLFVAMNMDNQLAQRAEEGVTMADLVGQKLLVPNELAYPGLAPRIRSLVASQPGLDTRRHYGDLVTFYLEIQVDDCMGFSSGFNREIYGNRVAFVPLRGVDTQIDVCAFWRDSLQGEALAACRKAFEVCRQEVCVRPVGAKYEGPAPL